MSIADIFECHGEAAFRDGERRVIARLLSGPPHVLALGGGAFLDTETRRRIAACAVSVWLDVPIDELVKRVQRKPGKRPLLAGTDVRVKLLELQAQREPVYAEADIRLPLSKMTRTDAVKKIIEALDIKGLDRAAQKA